MSSERAGLYSVFPALFLYLYIGFSSIYVNGSITFLLDFEMWRLFWSVEIAKLAQRARTQTARQSRALASRLKPLADYTQISRRCNADTLRGWPPRYGGRYNPYLLFI